ncbi:hypothetical protein N7492_007885 [Penicillium capsulatum]|uniref:Uncharacterized protein n=1 Tax=Penicillium capsulatum TaxID=69766 RepID=A0A9W9I2Y9_9EURO|nr:hypothetical protein N7492_007885 [Penicillium capsulatum]
MVSRTRMMWSLLTCFVAITRKTRAILISVSCGMLTTPGDDLRSRPKVESRPVLSIQVDAHHRHLIQGGISDSTGTFRTASHWPTCIGLGFNPAIDFFPEVLAAVQLWQFFPQTMNQNPNLSFADLAHNHPEGGPFLSESIVKTNLQAEAPGRPPRLYGQYHLMWVKIENLSLLLACGNPGYYWIRSRSTDNDEIELKRRTWDQWLDSIGNDWLDVTPAPWKPTECSESHLKISDCRCGEWLCRRQDGSCRAGG